MPSESPYDLSAIVHQVMANYGFVVRFPPAVLRETQSLIKYEYSAASDPSVRDLRDILWSSIDNVDSRDLDQIEFCQRAPNREIRVWVAIADVDHYVPKGSLVDEHASHNGASVYTGVEIFPMLPERLCTDISSLNPDEDRLVVVTEFFVLRDGDVRPGEIFRAIVRNKAKLVYEEIGEWLEGEHEKPEIVGRLEGLEEQLRLQDEAADRLHKFRMERGALELETIEPRTVMKDGTVQDLVLVYKNRARYIIENFMIASNGAMVDFLTKNGRAHIHRIVRRPERWPQIRDIAATFGDELPEEPDARALSEFLIRRRQADADRFPDLSLTIIKLLGSGEYVMAEPGGVPFGHFGLAVQDYTHSTAPNRRYIDVVIQRLLKAVLAKERTPYGKGELESIAYKCTERDHAAKKVERFMRKVAAAVLLHGHVGEVFEGIVTGASFKGTYVRLFSPPVEGRVIRGEAGMHVGSKVLVRLIAMDVEQGFVDFEGAGHMARDYRYPRPMSRKNRNPGFPK
jgi:VacB/RNase II family 3'-5' exoribonuclease